MSETGKWDVEQRAFDMLHRRDNEPCKDCGQPSAVNYAESSMQFARGYFERLCELCATKRQITHAETCVANLPTLLRKRAELENGR